MSPQQPFGGYPGRGIVVQRDGRGVVHWTYFVTGRSASSQARRFVREPAGLAVAPTDPDAPHDDLRHYHCVIGVPGTAQIVVGNGDHVAAIAARLGEQPDLDVALVDLTPEPDPPINTPRIAAVLSPERVELAIVRQVDSHVERRADEIALAPGEAVCLQTYDGDLAHPVGAAPLHRLRVPTGSDLAAHVWDSLAPDLRVLVAAGTAATTEPTLLIE